jgi:lanosterol synthase
MAQDAPELPKAKTPIEAAKNGFEFYKRLQTEDGHWAGEYGGPMYVDGMHTQHIDQYSLHLRVRFLVPGLIISYYITGTPIPDHERLEIIRYLLNRAHPDDGGWGLHIEGHSTVFITALTYVALRILGLGADHPALIKARGTLHRMGM